jgi:hypothetical protein
MSKPIIYFLILVLLGAGIYFLIIRKNDNPYGTKEAGFTIKDTASVYKIFISTNDNQAVTVERKNGSEWTLNGTMKALPSTVDMVLTTLQKQEVVAPVTQVAYEPVIKSLASEGIKVEVYGKDNKKLAVFYVGGPSANGNGTNMLMEGAKMPYVVQTPGFTGSLRSRYTTRVADWRDRTVFNIPAANLKSVAIQWEGKPLNSYVFTKNGNSYTVTGDPSVTTKLGPLNESRAKVYAGYFTNVYAEGFLNGYEGMDTTIKNSDKLGTIDVETTSSEKQHADIYWMNLNRRSKNQLTGDDVIPDKYDADRMYAVINGGKDTVLIQTLTFFKLLRKSYEFYSENTPEAPQQNQNVLIKDGKSQMKGTIR